MNKMVTVVLPCYNERDNVAQIVQKINAHPHKKLIDKIIFVDDNSPDNTAAYIKNELCPQYANLQCILRIGRSGLSSAVAEGVLAANSPYVAVMDADGQHRVEDLFAMLEICQQQHSDLVIGSRFKDVAKQQSHTGFRQLLSEWGNSLVNRVLKRNISDSLTGFFIVKRELFTPVAEMAQKAGFKILVDIIYYYRNRDISITEQQIEFCPRQHGDSKLDSAVMLEFADQILNYLSNGLIPAKFFSFATVGLSGVLVHVLVAYIANIKLGFSFNVAVIIATIVSMVSNYMLNNLITFRRRRQRGWAWLAGLLKFTAICSIGAVANVGLAGYLNNSEAIWAVAVIAGVIVGTIFNFVLTKQFVWGS